MVFNELLFEVSKYRSEILEEIDQDFALIKKNRKDLAAKKQLIKHIKEFTGVKNIVITIKKDYFNAAIIPLYNQIISTDLINIFKDYKPNDDIKDIEVVEEPSKYIKKLYIILGDGLIDKFTERELTAVILHELGHSFTYTSNLPRILLSLFQKSIGVVGMTLKYPILWLLNLITIPAYIASSLIIITIVRSLTFVEHRSEYKADQFAVKYGYGDEMIRVLYALHGKEQEKKEADNNVWWKKIWNFIEALFSPSSHPPSTNRIKEVNEHMINEYKKLYPKLSNELNIILKDINTSS